MPSLFWRSHQLRIKRFKMGYLENKCSSNPAPQTFKCNSLLPSTSLYHSLYLWCVSEAPLLSWPRNHFIESRQWGELLVSLFILSRARSTNKSITNSQTSVLVNKCSQDLHLLFLGYNHKTQGLRTPMKIIISTFYVWNLTNCGEDVVYLW